MSSSDDLNIALRVQAKFDDARRGVQQLKGDVVELGEAGRKASTDLAHVPTPSAQTDWQQKQAQAAEATAQATDKEKAAIDRLIGSLDPAAVDSQKLAAAQVELNTALSKGLVTQEQHTRLVALAQQRYTGLGVSAGQTAAAMRMLPAQITDITTSLASGMPVWLVAIQQGGQIKDSFGGIGPAAKAMTALLSPAKLAVGGLAVGIGTLAAIMIKGERDALAYNVAIQTTGNAAGATLGRIKALAEEANRVSGISKSVAESAAVAMVQSGRLGIQVIGNLTTAVNGYAQATGQSVDAAASSLAKLFADPARAAKQLDDQFNFLSASQRRHIALLVEQGRAEQAQLELSRAAADHFGRVVPDNLGILQRAWQAVTGAAGSAWSAMLGIGQQKSLDAQLQSQEATVAGLQQQIERRGTRALGNLPQLLAAAQGRLTELQGQLAQEAADADGQAAKTAEERRIKLLREQFDAEGKAYKTEAEKLAAAKKDLDALLAAGTAGGGISQDEYDTRLKALRERANKGGAKGDSAAAVAIQQIKSDLAALQAAIKSSDAVLVKALEEGRVSLDDAYAQRLAALREDSAAQRKALEDEARTAGTTKARKVEIQAQLKVLGTSLTTAEQALADWRKAEELKLANLTVRLRVDTAALTGQFDRRAIEQQLRQQYAGDLQAAGRISDPAEANAAKERIELLLQAAAAQAEFNNKLAEAQRLQGELGVIEQAIQNQVSSGQISQIQGEAKIQQARAAQVPMLQQIVAELERIRDALPPDAVVALDSMNTSIGQLRNTAAAATPVVVDLGTRLRNTVIDGMADAAATAVANWSNLRDAAATTLKQIAADIVRSDIKRLLTNLFTVDSGSGGGTTVIGAVASGVRSVLGFAEGGSPSTGGRIVGPGTGTSDSIPALVDGVRPIRVSNNEFIHPERAVQHYGLPFMEAVRTLRLPKPQFAFGGLVSASQRVRFATGGSVSSSSGSESATSAPQVLVRFTNTGTAKQQVGDAKVTQESGSWVIDVLVADAQNGGRGTRAIKAAMQRN
ncbi:MAG: phage tail length tape measure family protein [Comamonas sp.]